MMGQLHRQGGGVVATLEDPRTDRLQRSPLSLVVCQVRHERRQEVEDPKVAIAVHGAVKEDMPILEEQTSQEMMLAGGATGLQASATQVARGWKMRAEDQAWTSVLMPDSFSIETTKYQDWSDFAPRVRLLTETVAAVVAPALEARIGLRFIDRISHPDVEKATDWHGLIKPMLLGPIGDPALGASVFGTQNVVHFEFEAGKRVGLRYGSTTDESPGGGPIFLLDTDCFVQRGSNFDVEDLLGVVESLHNLALQIFQWGMEDKLYSFLKGEP
jgi:uncharacterized protein (TIGR04255 family)